MNTKEIIQSPTGDLWSKIGIKHHHGINVPLFSLKTHVSAGIGEFMDLIPLLEWCKEIGFDVIQLLPCNDTESTWSPYSIISAFALNPIYLSLSHLPYFKDDEYLKFLFYSLQKLNEEQRINYPLVFEKKRQFLRHYYERYADRIISEEKYKNFIHSEQWLEGYALFKAIKEVKSFESWEWWEDNIKNPDENTLKKLKEQFRREIDFHIFIQYLCFEQLKSVKQKANECGVLLKGDIPILINRDSADVWLNRSLFDLSYLAGSPPDIYNWEGQVWGFPLYNWEALKEKNYSWWRQRLQTASSLYHVYRIDHIVGFFRIWGVPPGKPGHMGKFIPEDSKIWNEHGTEILKMMIESSSMLPIGEDLGTVPPESRLCMKKLGISGTKVLRWERMWNEDKRFIKFADYIPLSMTTVSTHDSETLQEWWINNPEEAREFSHFMGWTYAPDLSKNHRREILKSSHHTGSLFHINLLNEYLALFQNLIWPLPEDERINIPGIISDKNWTYRFRPTLEEIIANAELKKEIRQIIQK
jgi:4-alpha-glucanotransferase